MRRQKTEKELANELVEKGFVGRERANNMSIGGLHIIANDRGVPLERDATTPPIRHNSSRPFFTHDSNKDIFSELRKSALEKDAQNYPDDIGHQMIIKNMNEQQLVDEAKKLGIIKPYEADYLKDRLSGKHHNPYINDPKYMPPLRDRSPSPVRTARQQEQKDERERNVAHQLRTSISTSTRGVTPGRSALRSSSSSNERPNLQTLQGTVNNASSRPNTVSPQRARVQRPLQTSDNSLVEQVRSSMNTLHQRSASDPLPRPVDDPLNDFASNLGRPAEEATRGVQFPDEAIDPQTGLRAPLRDSVMPIRSRFQAELEPAEKIRQREQHLEEIRNKVKEAETKHKKTATFANSGTDLDKLWIQKAIEGYNLPETLFPDSGYIPRNKLQEEADAMVEQTNPNSKERQDYQRLLESTLKPALTRNVASDAAAPFLKRMSENPAQYHKELMGNVESNHLDTINNRVSREFNEKILPGIHAKYQVPGLRQHGHMGRDIGRASELAARGMHEANSKAAVDIRGLTLNAGLQHANMQGQGASIAGKTADSDMRSQQGAVKTADDIRNNQDTRNELYRQTVSGIGNLQRAEHIEKQRLEREHLIQPEKNARIRNEKLVEQAQKQAQSKPTTNADLEQKGPVIDGRSKMALAKMISGSGRNLTSGGGGEEKRAKGGTVKGKRLKRAEGGPVNSMTEEAIENAITQRTDPLAELRRLFNVDIRKTNPWETKKYYAIGGQVSPIEAGAEAAKEYSLQRSQIERMRQAPKRKPRWLEVLDAGMSAAAGPDGGAFGNMASGWKNDLDRENTQIKERESKLTKADELEYQLEKDIAERAHKERDMVRQEKLANAQIGHIGAQNTHLGLQGDKIRHEMNSGLVDGEDKADIPKAGQKSHERDKVSDYKDRATLAAKMKETIAKIRDVLGRVSIGPRTGQSLDNLGPTITSALKSLKGDKSREKDYVLLSQLRTQLIRQEEKLEHVKGMGNRSNMGIQLMLDSKLDERLAKEDFMSGLSEKEKGVDMILDDLSSHIRSNKGSYNDIAYPLKYKSPVITNIDKKPPSTPVVGGKTTVAPVSSSRPPIRAASNEELQNIINGD